MRKMATCLIYKEGAEEAVKFYEKTFKGCKIKGITKYGPNEYGKEGTVRTIDFEMFGQDFLAVNGGDHFSFTHGVSLMVYCNTQKEIDTLWSKILKAGGKEAPCGWIADKWGLWWQITPVALIKMMTSKNAKRQNQMTLEMYKMKKLDIARLKKAYSA